jgi:glycosyltransferase involved in cell wall biosynthesis
MRVALLTYNAPAGNAIGNQLAEKVAFFLDRGAEVRVFLESDFSLHEAIRRNAQVLDAGCLPTAAWNFLASADLVVAEYGHYYPLLGLLPALVGGRPRIVLDYHGVTPAALWDVGNREMVEAGARWRGLVWSADAALIHSEFARRELLDATGFPPARVAGLGYVIDNTRFFPGQPARPVAEQLSLGPASLLLFVGRLAPNKRVPVLVEALARLRDLVPAVHAVLVGDSSDVYQVELQRCQDRATALGVADRLHCLGHVDDARLPDVYRSAAVLVMPSRHEGFGLPVLEAMACGVPVIAARAAALPETVGSAGLTFMPDDPEDLARHVRRVLLRRPGSSRGRTAVQSRPDGSGEPSYVTNFCAGSIAIVSFRYGTDFAGGAETSLRTIAKTLHVAGHHVEVFSTCTRSVADWTNDLPEGTTENDGMAVHRFRVDRHDRNRHLETVSAVKEAKGKVAHETGLAYFAHSIQSSRLLEALRQRIDEFDAVIVGPYLLGLTHAVARTFPDKTILLPCFHDEAFARLAATRETYEQVAGILYHSPEEQELAERDLGVNHPNALCCGTFLNTASAEVPAAQGLRSELGRYVVYCGRYSDSKGVPRLIEYARRYHGRSHGRFTFVFMGEGEVAIPREPWARDLSFADEPRKQGVMAGAAALVQLSDHESLSLVALEAWTFGVPVVANAGCPVLAAQIHRSAGGQVVGDFDDFARALDDLWTRPEHWQALGHQGRQYVRAQYGSRQAFADKLGKVIADMNAPLAEQMRRRGLERAASFSRQAWRDQFDSVVEKLLHEPARPHREYVEVQPRIPARTVAVGTTTALIPISVVNRGTHAVVHEGAARMVLRYRIHGEDKASKTPDGEEIPLPGLLLPGRNLAAAVPVAVPATAGTFDVTICCQRAAEPANQPACPNFRLVVESHSIRAAVPCCAPLLDLAEAALAEAQRLQRLPDNYTDVTEGRFCRWKRWIKRKLLGNFKHAYVDVLSRQQSAVNAQLVAALREVTECVATLDHAVRLLQDELGRRQNRARSRHAAPTRKQRVEEVDS